MSNLPRADRDPLTKEPGDLRPRPVKSNDGLRLSPEVDAKLNEQVWHCFNDDPGPAVLDWMRTITVNRAVTIDDLDPQQLAFREGQRNLLALIYERMTRHEERGTSDE